MTLHEVLMSSVFAVVLGNAQAAAHELIWLDIWRMAKATTTTCIRKPFIEIFCTFWGQSVEKTKIIFHVTQIIKMLFHPLCATPGLENRSIGSLDHETNTITKLNIKYCIAK